jgi:hypothetical protein
MYVLDTLTDTFPQVLFYFLKHGDNDNAFIDVDVIDTGARVEPQGC